MKALMFGWEFPPHISGGLGTACYGLTQSLLKNKVKVLFVVPRIFGDESEAQPFLINASMVKNRSHRKSASLSAPAVSPQSAFRSVQREAITYIEIPAGLVPYNHPQDSLPANRKMELRAWNYSLFSQGGIPDIGYKDLSEDRNISEPQAPEELQLTGMYGANLMDEVKRYANAGCIIARQYSFDVIHAHDWMTFPAGIAAKRESKKPLVVHVHSTEFDRAGDRRNKTVVDIEKLGFSEADRIIAVSNWTKQIVMTRYNVPEKKITVVHNGITPKAQPTAFIFPEIGSHFVTFLGRVTHQKGPGFFVEAAKKVLQEFPDAHFIVAGAGDLLPQIIERVAQLNMSANFHFTGFLSVDQVDQIWSMTDVYVMPSVSEPFGIAPLEAIQGDVPVILSKQSGVSEVMPHAIKVDFWDIKSLSAAICSVLRYESLSQVLRQNGKKHIQHLTWDKAAREVKEVYHELTKNR